MKKFWWLVVLGVLLFAAPSFATVASTYTPVQVAASGTEDEFDFTFKVFNASELEVALVDQTTLVATAQTLGSDYTVALNTSTPGGTVTFLSAPADTNDVSIRRAMPVTQTADIPAGGLFREVQIENALDKTVMILQDHDEQLDRAVLQSPYVTAVSVVFPEPVADNVIGWDAAGTQLENKVGLDTAVDAAETAQGLAEAARDASVTAQGLSEDARDASIVAQGLAEAVLTDAGFIAVAADLAGANTIGAVAAVAADVTSVAAVAADVATVAGVATDVTTVAAVDTEVTTVSGIAADVTAVAAVDTAVTAVSTIAANVTSVAAIDTDVTTCATNIADIQAAPQAAIDAAAAAASIPTFTRATFDNDDLTAGVLTITHNLGLSAPYATNIFIFDNTGNLIIPDEITGAADSVAVDLTSYGAISGTWGYAYLAG